MEAKDFKKLARRIMSTERAGRATDPQFYAGLGVLPNPDPILRAMGRADQAYDAIMSDAHVLGELQSIKAGLTGFKLRVKSGAVGDETPQEAQARELCEQWMRRRPAPGMTWHDVVWNMGCAVFKGFSVHEMVWDVVDGQLVPVKVLDRANRRFIFTPENHLRVLTKQEPTNGEETEEYEFLLTRHMPSTENPYGRAVLSACFWPYTFKHGGFKFFYQFCERYGMPFPIGKYPAGTQPKEQQELLDALLELLANGVAALPEGDAVELLSHNHSGELVQEALIHLCNREMSKALTSQTLATEMQNVGSNAASKTHYDRQQDVTVSVRNTVAASFDQAFEWMTLFNYGEGVAAPKLEFYRAQKPTKDRAEQYEIASRLCDRVPVKAFLDEMNIPMADPDEEVLRPAPAKTNLPGDPNQFSVCPSCGGHHIYGSYQTEGFREKSSAQEHWDLIDKRRLEFAQAHAPSTTAQAIAAADKQIQSDWLEPIATMLAEYEASGKTLREFYNDLDKLGIALDANTLADINTQVIAAAFATGMDEQNG